MNEHRAALKALRVGQRVRYCPPPDYDPSIAVMEGAAGEVLEVSQHSGATRVLVRLHSTQNGVAVSMAARIHAGFLRPVTRG